MALFENGDGSRNKGAAASFGLGALGALTGIGGLIGNAISTRKTNQMNYRISQMNNEFNERMMREQMSWNEEMWNKQNEYNTPANQRARLEAAGLNPYMMLDGGSAGIASSANGVSPASASGNPVMQPYNFDTSSISGMLGNMAQMVYGYQLQQEQIEHIRTENEYVGADMLAKIMQIREETYSTQQKRMLDSLIYDIMKDTKDSVIKGKFNEVLLQEEQKRLMAIDVANRRIDLKDKQLFTEKFGNGPLYYDFLARVYDLSTKDLTQKQLRQAIRKLAYEADSAYVDFLRNHGTFAGDISATNAENQNKEDYFTGASGFGTPAERQSWREYSDSDKSASDAAREYYPHNSMTEEAPNGDTTKGYTSFVNSVERLVNVFKGIF